MTSHQRKHRDKIAREFLNEFPAKYNKGQKEHGGNLWQKPLAQEMVNEFIDGYCLAKTIQMQHREIRLLTFLIEPKNAKEKAALEIIRKLTK
jgi:hypothetical protein